MDFSLLLFYLFGAVLIGSSLLVITVRNPVHAALFLVVAFVNAAGLWLLAYAEFLAITLVLVYVGAVMVLFLFVVMMLDINLERLREGFWRNLPLAGAVGALMVIEMGALFWRAGSGSNTVVAPAPGFSNSKALGAVMYTDYVYPFELAAVVLLVAIVAAIALTLRQRKETKYQDAATQLAARPGDRLKIVKLPSETEVPVEAPREAAK
jgi:NADH-quinone oxidoreductase subunit J